jgi:hypothetical protein
MYAEEGLLCHPLVSPMAAKSWEGSCPMWMVAGEELLADENKYFAMKAAQQGVTVVFEEFEAMPHCFAMLLDGMPNSDRCYRDWAAFISACVEKPKSLATKGVRFAVRTLEESAIDVTALSPFTEDEVKLRMRERMKELSMNGSGMMAKL